MLTIFTIPKPFHGPIGLIQRNAILSWTRLTPSCEVILLSDEEGVREFAAEHDLQHLPVIETNEYGTPLLSSAFEQGQAAATFDRLAYVNADIILMSDFAAAVAQVDLPKQLLVGRRWDITIDEAIDFDRLDWESVLRQDIASRMSLDSPWSIDYFVFRRNAWSTIPPFAIGRFAWDNWLIGSALDQGIEVVDLTEAVMAIHQHHDYHTTLGFDAYDWDSPEVRRNIELSGSKMDYSVQNAVWRLRCSSDRHRRLGTFDIVYNRGRYWMSYKRYIRQARRRLGRVKRFFLNNTRRAA